MLVGVHAVDAGPGLPAVERLAQADVGHEDVVLVAGIDPDAELVEDLAQQLHAPALIEDDELRMVAYSAHDVLIDDIRRDSILVKRAPAAVSGWLRRFGLEAAAGPVRIPGDQDRGILGRLCVPVSYRGARLGYLWLIDDDGRLGSTQVRTGTRRRPRPAC